MSKLSTAAIDHALHRAHEDQQRAALAQQGRELAPEGPFNLFAFFNIQAVDGEGHCVLGLGPLGEPIMTYSYYRNGSALKAPGVMACLKTPELFSSIVDADGWIVHGNPGNWWNEHMDAAIAFSCERDVYEKVRAYAEHVAKDPGTYDFVRHNCLDFVEDALAQGGVKLLTRSGRPLHTIVPRDAFEETIGADGARPFGQWKYWFPITPGPDNGLRTISDNPKAS